MTVAPDRVSIASYAPIPAGKQQYPEEYCEAHGVLKLNEDPEAVDIGVTESTSPSIRESLQKFHDGKTLRFHEIDRMELAAHLGTRASESDSMSAKNPDSDDERLLLDRLANDAPIVNLVNSLCIEGIRCGASDIHMEAQEGGIRIRYRVDGVLKTVKTLDRGRFPAVASRIKIMANLNIMERRLPQDGRMTVEIGDDTVDLRVSIIPTIHGESIVLRLFNRKKKPLGLDQLGFSESDCATLRKFLTIQHGLILVTGPTGSGKTTTLNAMVREICAEGLKIITIEDPVEYTIDGVNQIQTNDMIGLSFDSILRRVLRQDPNVIMVGEIRDSPTAELAVRAALTGHLVLSTLHTNDSVAVISRLANMGIEPYLIASVLRGATAQRLVRKLCPACAIHRLPTEAEQRILTRYGIDDTTVADARGCSRCGGTGYLGRTVLSEIFTMDPILEELITARAPAADISAHVRTHGCTVLARDGVEKVRNGTTTLDELMHEVSL